MESATFQFFTELLVTQKKKDVFESHPLKQFLEAIIWFIHHKNIIHANVIAETEILDVFHQNYDTFIDEEIFSILDATEIEMK